MSDCLLTLSPERIYEAFVGVTSAAIGAASASSLFVLNSLDEFVILQLENIVKTGIKEIIFALTPSISNDAVILYIEEKLSYYELNFSKIAQGVPTGVSLENIDILSLTRALEDRVRV